MTFRITTSISFLTVALLSLGCGGDDTPNDDSSIPAFGIYDTNGDGYIQMSEWGGAAADFAAMDANADNLVSNDEYNAFMYPDTGETGAETPDATIGTEEGDTGDESTEGNTETGEETPECDQDALGQDADFWVVYGMIGRVPGENKDEFELFVSNPQGGHPFDSTNPDPLSITDFSLKGEAFRWCPESPEWEVSCKYGCTVDEGMNWIAVGLPVPGPEIVDPNSPNYDPSYDCLQAGEIPTATLGFSIWLGQLDVALKAKMIKGAILKNTSHFTFGGGKMFYSKQADCIGPSCFYEVHRVDLETNVNIATKLLTFPPNEELADSIFKGYFEVSPDGEMLSLLNPTIRSQSYWVWENGTLHHLKLLCMNRQNGNCIGTGSHYTDRDPTALSPDKTMMGTFTIAESNQRVWRYLTNQEAEPLWSNMVTVPAGSDYYANACMHMSNPWEYKDITGVQFTEDGQSLLYLGYSECGAVGTKAETDILSLPIDVIGSGKPISEEDVFNITQNPKDNSSSNIVIGSFDTCPDGKVLAFTGTPSLDSQGVPLDNSQQSTFSDQELYLITSDGCVKTQLTKDVTWEVNSVKCIPPKDIPPPPGG